MKEIELTHGMVALVDDEDYERLNQFKWYAFKHRKTYYARRSARLPTGKMWHILLHRAILDVKPGMQIDHKDGNGLNNTRDNLRPCTQFQNARNSGIQSNNTSGYIGVWWAKDRGKWVACVRTKGIRRHLGNFDTAEAAARAYDSVACELFGEFARLNFP